MFKYIRILVLFRKRIKMLNNLELLIHVISIYVGLFCFSVFWARLSKKIFLEKQDVSLFHFADRALIIFYKYLASN